MTAATLPDARTIDQLLTARRNGRYPVAYSYGAGFWAADTEPTSTREQSRTAREYIAFGAVAVFCVE